MTDMRYHRHEPDLEMLARDKHRKDSAGSRRMRAPQAAVYRGRALPTFYRDPTPALYAAYANIGMHLAADWRAHGLAYDIDYVERATTQMSLPGMHDPDLDIHCRGISRLIEYVCTKLVKARKSEQLPDPPADAYGLLLWFGVALRIARAPSRPAAIASICTVADIVAAFEAASAELVPFVAVQQPNAAAAHASIIDELRKISEPTPDPDDKRYWEEEL